MWPKTVSSRSSCPDPVIKTAVKEATFHDLCVEEEDGRFDATVVRLPGLYGRGLKKNIIYDLLHDNELHKLDARGVFQFYGVRRLWADIEVMLANRLPLVHLPTEPVSVGEIAREAFGMEFNNELAAAPVCYDVGTKHAALFGGRDRYVEDRQRVVTGIREFVNAERRP